MSVTPILSCDAVLFDMDGTLVDSTAAVERAWTAWAVRHDLPVEEVLATCHGDSAEATVRRWLPWLDEVGVGTEVAGHLAQECIDLDDVRPAKGALELIRLLEERAVPWAVVTNAPERLAAARLGAAGINPPALVTLDDVCHGKPSPEGFIEAARRIDVAIDRCLAVEDSPSGIQAASASGARVVVVGRAEGHLSIIDLTHLHALIETR